MFMFGVFCPGKWMSKRRNRFYNYLADNEDYTRTFEEMTLNNGFDF